MYSLLLLVFFIIIFVYVLVIFKLIMILVVTNVERFQAQSLGTTAALAVRLGYLLTNPGKVFLLLVLLV